MFIPRALTPHHKIASFDNKTTKSEFRAMKSLKFTCSCCGFIGLPTKSVPHANLEFVEVNGSLHLLCILCAQSQHLQRGVELGSGEVSLNHGVLVYCPELSQGEIISIARDLFLALLYKQQNIGFDKFGAINEQHNAFIKRLTENHSNIPSLNISEGHLAGYVSLYKFAPKSLIDREQEVFGSIRYLPSMKVYRTFLEHWLKTSYSSLIPL